MQLSLSPCRLLFFAYFDVKVFIGYATKVNLGPTSNVLRAFSKNSSHVYEMKMVTTDV